MKSPSFQLKTVWFIILSLIIVITSKPVYATGNEPEKKIQTVEALQDTIEKIMKDYKIPGCGIALVHKDSVIWIGGLGKANIKNKTPMTEKTFVRVASITKSFVALAIMKLVEENKISLNDKVKDIAPELIIENSWEETDPVRVVHILEHTAGFDDMHPNESVNIGNKADVPLEKELSINPASRKVRWKPGTRMAYSNPDYAIAGYLIEKVTGMPFEDYIKKVIFDPIEMKSSSARLTDEIKKMLAMGYNAKGDTIPYQFTNLRPAGCIHSSPEEMAKFVHFWLNDGMVDSIQIFKESTLRRMEAPQTTLGAKAGLSYGYGLAIMPEYYKGFKYHGHGGALYDFLSYYGYMRDYNMGFFFSINTGFSREGLFKIRNAILSYLTHNLESPEAKSIYLTPEQMNQYTGYYESRNPRMQLTAFMDLLMGGESIRLKNDTLFRIGFRGKKTALIPVTENTFRTKDDADATLVFTKDEEGNTVLTGYMDYYVKTAGWKPWVYRGFLIAALLFILSSVLFSIIWLLLKAFGKLKKAKEIQLRLTPVLPIFLGLISFLLFSTAQQNEMVQLGWRSISMYLIGWLILLSSIYGLLLVLKSYTKPISKLTRLYLLLVSLSNCGVSFFLLYWGIIGLALWSY